MSDDGSTSRVVNEMGNVKAGVSVSASPALPSSLFTTRGATVAASAASATKGYARLCREDSPLNVRAAAEPESCLKRLLDKTDLSRLHLLNSNNHF